MSVEGVWSSWGVWGSCSTSCGQGLETRNREHSDGTPCSGSSSGTRSCQGKKITLPNLLPEFITFCIVEGTWSTWSEWDTCSTSCGQGTKSRSRVHSGGTPCSGSSTEADNCQGLLPIVYANMLIF